MATKNGPDWAELAFVLAVADAPREVTRAGVTEGPWRRCDVRAMSPFGFIFGLWPLLNLVLGFIKPVC